MNHCIEPSIPKDQVCQHDWSRVTEKAEYTSTLTFNCLLGYSMLIRRDVFRIHRPSVEQRGIDQTSCRCIVCILRASLILRGNNTREVLSTGIRFVETCNELATMSSEANGKQYTGICRHLVLLSKEKINNVGNACSMIWVLWNLVLGVEVNHNPI